MNTVSSKVTPLIETTDLTRRFGRKDAVYGLSLSVPAGSVFALLGPNGAGKTTTIKVIMNILRPSRGSAVILGRDSRQLGPSELAQIGYVSENQQLPEWMTVRELLAFCRPLYSTWDDALCQKLRRDFDLPLTTKLKHLSRGMRVKAALLSSLAYRPRLLVLDEPFSGLDPMVRDQFTRGILELAGDEGWTVFISSHDIDEVERLADTAAFLDEGRLMLIESVASLAARFRRVEVVGIEEKHAPAALPASWIEVQSTGRTLRFVDAQHAPAESERALADRWPDREIRITPMSLREIFLTLVRTHPRPVQTLESVR